MYTTIEPMKYPSRLSVTSFQKSSTTARSHEYGRWKRGTLYVPARKI